MNPVYQHVKEVREEENPDVIIEMLASGNWVAIGGVNDRGVLKLMLGRVNLLPEDLTGQGCAGTHPNPCRKQYEE